MKNISNYIWINIGFGPPDIYSDYVHSNVFNNVHNNVFINIGFNIRVNLKSTSQSQLENSYKLLESL